MKGGNHQQAQNHDRMESTARVIDDGEEMGIDKDEGLIDDEEETGIDDDREEAGGWKLREGSNDELLNGRIGKNTKGDPGSGRPRWYVMKTNNDFGCSSFSSFPPFSSCH